LPSLTKNTQTFVYVVMKIAIILGVACLALAYGDRSNQYRGYWPHTRSEDVNFDDDVMERQWGWRGVESDSLDNEMERQSGFMVWVESDSNLDDVMERQSVWMGVESDSNLDDVMDRTLEVEDRLSAAENNSVSAAKRNYVQEKYRLQIIYLKNELEKEEARHAIKLNDVVEVYEQF